MDTFLMWFAGTMGLMVGLIVGAALYAWWMSKIARSKRRVPTNSKIGTRVLVNSREKRVWRWLIKTFPDRHVMIKMPVTRFTVPMAEGDRQQWFAVLNDVYCTFTLANPDGKVIGVVDVPGPVGISQSNLLVKRKLFVRCGIPHWIVEPDNLPKEADVRNAFGCDLDEPQTLMQAQETALSAAKIDKARAELHATVSRQRKTDVAPARSASPTHVGYEEPDVDGALDGDWAPDSFAVPLDSRVADLT